MFGNLRQAMTWLHSILGLWLGLVLLVVFFMGSLAVFDHELDRWMLPATRLSAPATAPSLDRQVRPVVARLTAGQALEQWYVELPDARVPALRLQVWDRDDKGTNWFLDPRDGRVLAHADATLGGEFFYRFHYTLQLEAGQLGLRLVGVAAMAGLLVIVAGLVIHARLVKDFFTFRPTKALPRRLLDLHNLSGVLPLPFHIVILFTGLVLSFPGYLPSALTSVYGEETAAFWEESRSLWSRPPAEAPGRLASLDAMVVEAERRWQGGAPAFVRVWHPGDAHAYVEMRRSLADRVSVDAEALYFDGASGALLHASQRQPAASVFGVLAGLHLVHFQQPLMRGLYFLAGVLGCVMLASGMWYWLARARERQALGRRLLTGLTGGVIAGLPLATLAVLVTNRLLPMTWSARADAELAAFGLAWAGALLVCLGAAVRSSQAQLPWRGLCGAVAVLAGAAVLGNGLSTGDWPWRAVAAGQWAVAGVDAVLVLVGLIGAGFWWRGRRRERAESAVVEGLPDA